MCNTTLNDYKNDPADNSFEPFLFSPKFSGSMITGYTETEALKIPLEKAMALSGAAFATSMGRVDIAAVRTNGNTVG